MKQPTWQNSDGRVQLWLGDCLKILPEIGKVDAVITDPPYPNSSGIMETAICSSLVAFELLDKIYKNVMFWFWDSLSMPPFKKQPNSRHVWHKTNGWQAGKWELRKPSFQLQHQRQKLVPQRGFGI